jgi:hypothetical protein
MEFLNFTFADGWHFFGVLVLLCVCGYAVSGWFQINNNRIISDDEDEEDF